MSAFAVRSLLFVAAIVTGGAGRPQVLPAGTAVKLSFAQSVSSDHAVQGERVELRVAEDVTCGETVVIRGGTRVLGTVIVGKKTEKREFGPGLTITLDYIVTPERRISLTGRQEWARKGHTGSEVASGIFFGVGGYLMSRGRRVARVEEGTIATAFTAEDVPLLVAPGIEDCAPRAQASAAPRVTATGFSIATPSGSDWTTKRSRLGFTFERKREGTAPCKTTQTYLLAERNFTMGDRSRLSEEEVAEDFRNMEEAGMRVMGVQVGQYDLTGVQRGVNTRGDKKLYFMKYRTVTPPMGRKSDRRAVADATLYLHFPSTFADDRFFFVFLDQATCAAKTGDVPPQSMDDILPIIDSLRVDSSLR